MHAAHPDVWLAVLAGARIALSILCFSTIAFYAWAGLLARESRC
jgi:hypothetical protein